MEGFDWTQFIEMAALGTPLSNYVIRALVQWCKRFKTAEGKQLIQGNALLVVSLAIGMVFGSVFLFVTVAPPLGGTSYDAVKYAFMVVIYGLIQGLLASGVYDSMKEEIQKASA